MNYLEYSTEEEALELIREELDSLCNDEIVGIHNQYCEAENYEDDRIYSNDEEFFETYFSCTLDAIQSAQYGDYSLTHDWVQFNGYANLDSTDDPTSVIDLNAIAQSIFDSHEKYYGLPFELEEVEPEEEDEEDEA